MDIKMNRKTCSIILLLMLVSVLARAETRVSGNVSGVWEIDGSPYIVTGDLTIPRNNRLVIEQGVEVLFDGDYRLTVNGGIIAEGEPENMILFSRNRRNDHWNSIYIRNPSYENTLSYCIIEYSESRDGGGLYNCNGVITVSDCIFRNNYCEVDGGAIYFEDCNPVVTDNRFYSNRAGANGGGVAFYNSDGEFARNIVTDNRAIRYSGGGLFLSYSSSPLVANNEFSGNSSYHQWGSGVYLDNNSNPDILYNLICDNDQGGVFLGASCRVNVFQNNTVVNNRGRCGILLYSGCLLNAVNCIIYGNSTASTWIIGSTLTADYSDIENLEDDVRVGDGVIDEDPLFINPDIGDYHLQEDSPCINTGDPESERDPDGTRADMGCFYYSHEILERTLEMPQGWSMISLNIEPLTTDIREMFAPLAQGDDPALQIMKDQLGRFYLPHRNFINIDEWDYSQGYHVFLLRPAELTVEGRFIEPDHDIDLDEGWWFVAYYPTWELNAVDAFASIVDNLFLVKNDDGEFYIPRYHFNDMAPLRPGKGYIVCLLDDDVLTYPSEPEERDASIRLGKNSQQRFYEPVNTSINMSLLVTGEGLRCGDEIVAYNGFERVVGSGIVNDEKQCGVALWGYTSELGEYEGLRAGETPHFMLRRGSYETDVLCSAREGSLDYETNGFALADILFDDNFAEVSFSFDQPYPNPFNNAVQIQYNLPEAVEIRIAVHDLSGREVAVLFNGSQIAGAHQTFWNSQGAATGSYLLRLESSGKLRTQKMVLIK